MFIEALFTTAKTWRGGQDGGGVGGRGVHLSLQMHQEYIYKWNNSHRAPAEH